MVDPPSSDQHYFHDGTTDFVADLQTTHCINKITQVTRHAVAVTLRFGVWRLAQGLHFYSFLFYQ